MNLKDLKVLKGYYYLLAYRNIQLHNIWYYIRNKTLCHAVIEKY